MSYTATSPYPHKGVVNRKGCQRFTHRVLVGAAGAITGQDADSRVSAAKQATAGQYLITLPKPYKRITDLGCFFIGNTGSIVPDFTTDNITSQPVSGAAAGNGAGTILLQFRNSAGAATDIANGSIFTLSIEVETGV